MMLAGVGITVMDKISDERCRILQVGQGGLCSLLTILSLTLGSGKPKLICLSLSHSGGKGAKGRTNRG